MTNKEDEQIVRPGTRYVLRQVGFHAQGTDPGPIYCATLVDIDHALRQWFPSTAIRAAIINNATAMEFYEAVGAYGGRTLAIMTEVFQ